MKSKFKNVYFKSTGNVFLDESLEDQFFHNHYYQKLRLFELLNALISFFSIVVGCAHYEFHYTSPYKGEYRMHLIINSIMTITLLLNILFSTLTEIEYKISIRELTKSSNFFNTGEWYIFLFKFVIFSVHPNVFLDRHRYVTINEIFNHRISQEINTVISIALFTRVYYIFKFMLINSVFMTPNAQNHCKSKFFQLNYGFSIKANFKYNAKNIYFYGTILVVYIYCYAIRVFERELDDVTSRQFDSFFNSMWYVLVTMTTVGYGDYTAATSEGRVFAVLSCVTGTFLLSMMVITLSNVLDMTPTEITMFEIMKICDLNNDINEASKRIIYDFLVNIIKKRKKNGKINVNKDYNRIILRSNKTKNLDYYINHNRNTIRQQINNKQNEKNNSNFITNDINNKSLEEDENNEYNTLREDIMYEGSRYNSLHGKIRNLKDCCEKKMISEASTDFTKHLEKVNHLIRSYSIIDNKQNKLQAEIFDIKTRLDKIANLISK